MARTVSMLTHQHIKKEWLESLNEKESFRVVRAERRLDNIICLEDLILDFHAFAITFSLLCILADRQNLFMTRRIFLKLRGRFKFFFRQYLLSTHELWCFFSFRGKFDRPRKGVGMAQYSIFTNQTYQSRR